MKVQKISLNAGFTCPNRDGTVGTGGCTYCNNQTFNPAYCQTEKSIRQQLEEGIDFFSRSHSGRKQLLHGQEKNMKFLAYFQAYTNTYGDIEQLRRKYEEALSVDQVVGIVIGTRPDCVDPPLLDYMEQLNTRCFLLVEYGIESTDDTVLRRINRGHDFAAVQRAVIETHQRGILTGGHIILGLPGTHRIPNYLQHEAAQLSALPLDTLKIHQLQLIRGTRMADEYAAHPSDFHLFTADEYIDTVIDFVEMLRPDLVLERFVSQSPSSLLAVPGWGLKNHEFVAKIRHRMHERDSWQGHHFHL